MYFYSMLFAPVEDINQNIIFFKLLYAFFITQAIDVNYDDDTDHFILNMLEKVKISHSFHISIRQIIR